MYKLLIVFLLIVSPAVRGQQPVVAEGRTMGTTWRVIYFDEPLRRDFQQSIDSLLAAVNAAISTYEPDSEISRFNAARRCFRFEGPHLRRVLEASHSIYIASDGAFDPTMKPLIDAWGFGSGRQLAVTDARIDSLRGLVGFHQIRLKRNKVCKTKPHVQVDMGGIGQGYGADVIAAFLKHHGVEHMLVELGGEGVAAGRNLQHDRSWTIGILNPYSTPDEQFFKAYVTLDDEAFTTSGNYFNYRVIEGQKYGHTVDPVTGRSVQHRLLSVSLFADDCTTVDGWATAFMVMGLEKAIDKLSTQKDLNAILMYATENGNVETWMTPAIRDKVTLE